jgi:RHS repeat-associated protein
VAFRPAPGPSIRTHPRRLRHTHAPEHTWYDANGNLVRRTEIATGAVRTLAWDFRNRLASVRDQNAAGQETQRVDFTYDAFNRRTSKTVSGGKTTYYVHDGVNVVLEFEGPAGGAIASQPSHRFLHGPAVDQVLAQEDALGEVLWPLADRLGSMRDVADSQGNVVNQIAYDSFGNVISESNPAVDSHFGYTGRELDAETGLHYYRERYYDSSLGQFISEDPVQFLAGDTNLRRYVSNNPVSYRDPFGLDIYIVGPSSEEPWGHQKIVVGHPGRGDEKSYSFGALNQLHSIVGIGKVYTYAKIDGRYPAPEGNIDKSRYRVTTAAEDAIARAELDALLEQRGLYAALWRNCRDFSEQQFEEFKGFGEPLDPKIEQFGGRPIYDAENRYDLFALPSSVTSFFTNIRPPDGAGAGHNFRRFGMIR